MFLNKENIQNFCVRIQALAITPFPLPQKIKMGMDQIKYATVTRQNK